MLYFIPSPIVVKVHMIVSHAKDTYSLFIFLMERMSFKLGNPRRAY